MAVASPTAAPPAQGDAAPLPPAVGERIPDGVALRVLGRDVKGPSGEVVAQVVRPPTLVQGLRDFPGMLSLLGERPRGQVLR